MTQHYVINGGGDSVNVWDHTGAKIADNRMIDGPGVPDTLGSTFPDEVRQALMEEASAAADSGNTQYALSIVTDVLAFDVTEGAP